MPAWRLHGRPPRGAGGDVATTTDPDVLAGFLQDAAHFPGGHASGVVHPRSEADVARAVRELSRVLPIGAQSSLTGGATPFGDVVIATSRLNRILEIGRDFVRVQAGVSLDDLNAALRP